MTWLIVYSRLEHAQVMYTGRGFSVWTDGLLEIRICSGRVIMERLLNEVIDCLLKVGT